MRDEETGSWWQQVSGKAIHGPLQGHQLKSVFHDEVSFAIWKGEQPDGRVLKPDEVKALMEEAKGGNHLVTVDLEAQTVVSPSGRTFAFEIDPQRRDKMLKGLDAIGETLQAAPDIDVYEMKRALARPWLEDA